MRINQQARWIESSVTEIPAQNVLWIEASLARYVVTARVAGWFCSVPSVGSTTERKRLILRTFSAAYIGGRRTARVCACVILVAGRCMLLITRTGAAQAWCLVRCDEFWSRGQSVDVLFVVLQSPPLAPKKSRRESQNIIVFQFFTLYIPKYSD